MPKAIFIIIRVQNHATTNYRICSGKTISSKVTMKSQLNKRFNHSIISSRLQHTNIYIYIYIYAHNSFISLSGTDQVWPKGPAPLLGPKFLFLFCYYIFYFRSWAHFKTLIPFSSISLVNLTQIATIQPKNLTKTIKNSR